MVVEDGLPTWFSGKVDTGCIAANGSSIAVADTRWEFILLGRLWAGLVMQEYRTADPERCSHLLSGYCSAVACHCACGFADG